MVTYVRVRIGSCGGLVPDGTKALPESRYLSSKVSGDIHLRATSQEVLAQQVLGDFTFEMITPSLLGKWTNQRRLTKIHIFVPRSEIRITKEWTPSASLDSVIGVIRIWAIGIMMRMWTPMPVCHVLLVKVAKWIWNTLIQLHREDGNWMAHDRSWWI